METLKKRSSFLHATKNGRHIITKGIMLQAVPNGTALTFFGFTASGKLGNAVVRNRIRRRLKALVREQLDADGKREGKGLLQSGMDYVLVGRPATLLREYGQLRGDLRYALHQLLKSEESK